jgi:hypothetical protein
MTRPHHPKTARLGATILPALAALLLAAPAALHAAESNACPPAVMLEEKFSLLH